MQVMILVVLAFVVLTGAAMLDAYGPCVGRARSGKAFGCFIGLLAFFSLVSNLQVSCVLSKEEHSVHAAVCGSVALHDCPTQV